MRLGDNEDLEQVLDQETLFFDEFENETEGEEETLSWSQGQVSADTHQSVSKYGRFREKPIRISCDSCLDQHDLIWAAESQPPTDGRIGLIIAELCELEFFPMVETFSRELFNPSSPPLLENGPFRYTTDSTSFMESIGNKLNLDRTNISRILKSLSNPEWSQAFQNNPLFKYEKMISDNEATFDNKATFRSLFKSFVIKDSQVKILLADFLIKQYFWQTQPPRLAAITAILPEVEEVFRRTTRGMILLNRSGDFRKVLAGLRRAANQYSDIKWLQDQAKKVKQLQKDAEEAGHELKGTTAGIREFQQAEIRRLRTQLYRSRERFRWGAVFAWAAER